MPSVPKPSQRSAASKPKRVRKSRAKTPKAAASPSNGHGAQVKEIAAQLGIGPGRVRSLVKSGRMKLTPESVQEYAASRRVAKKQAAAT